MLPIRGLYEVAVRVKDLPRAEVFYREILGLPVGIRDDRRNWLFLRVGGEAGMIVLREDKGEWPLQDCTVGRSLSTDGHRALQAGAVFRARLAHGGLPPRPSLAFRSPVWLPGVYSRAPVDGDPARLE